MRDQRSTGRRLYSVHPWSVVVGLDKAQNDLSPSIDHCCTTSTKGGTKQCNVVSWCTSQARDSQITGPTGQYAAVIVSVFIA